MLEKYLKPNWPAPVNIKAFSTTRLGGHSQGAYNSFNLIVKQEDDRQAVLANRALLKQELHMPADPVWLKQVHGVRAIDAMTAVPDMEADAIYTSNPHTVCLIATADCLPLLICNKQGSAVAAIHAGWRGLLAGVIENTLQAFNQSHSNLLVWLGPAIGPTVFELGIDIYQQFLQADPASITAFHQIKPDKYLANIYTLAKQRLVGAGVTDIFGGDFCTYTDAKRFYSYRRDRGETGRMASLIWLE